MEEKHKLLQNMNSTESHGKYKRTLIINDKKETIYLQRIYCKHCKKTHTIMPIFIVPYERKPLDYILDLVKGYNDKDISKADYENFINTNYKEYTELNDDKLDIEAIYNYSKNIETQNPHIVKARYIKGIEALNDK